MERTVFKPGTYSAGKGIPYSELSLRNICGNTLGIEDIKSSDEPFFNYEGYQIRPATREGAICWLPRSLEIERIVQVAENVSGGKFPSILEIGAGAGLLSFLLAQTERAFVTAVDPDVETLLGQSKDSSPYEHKNLQLFPGTSRDALKVFKDDPPDLIISSWMPRNVNLTGDIVKLKPKAIVYIYANDSYYEDIVEQKSIEIGKRFIPKRGYRRALTWQGTELSDVISWWEYVNSEKEDVISLISKNKLEFYGRTFFEVQLKKTIPDVEIVDNDLYNTYPWEREDVYDLLGPDMYMKFFNQPDKWRVLTEGLQRLLTVEAFTKHN